MNAIDYLPVACAVIVIAAIGGFVSFCLRQVETNALGRD